MSRPKTVLALFLTASAVYLGALNLGDRLNWKPLSDGVNWGEYQGRVVVDSVENVILKSSDGNALVGGDQLVSINGIPVQNLDEYVEILDLLGEDPSESPEVSYVVKTLASDSEERFVGQLGHQSLIKGTDWALGVLALIHLIVGTLIVLRSSRAFGAFHFYLLNLCAFVLYWFGRSGRADIFDLVIYALDSAALLLLPALFLHFCCFFPKPLPLFENMPRLRGAIYIPTVLLATVHAFWLTGQLQPLGLGVGHQSLTFVNRVELAYFVAVFLSAGVVLLSLQRRSASPVERQQMKWITHGTMFGIVPFALIYAVPYLLGIEITGPMNLSILSLGLIPLGWAYAITRYRLMDVDVLFKRGAAYALTSSAALAIFVGVVLLLGQVIQYFFGESGIGLSAGVALGLAFLFSPLKTRIQSQIDRYFYRDQYGYRSSLSDFSRNLGSEIRLPELIHKICQRISLALGTSNVSVFVRESDSPGNYELYQSTDENVKHCSLSVPTRMLSSPESRRLSSTPANEDPETAAARTALLVRGIEHIQPLKVRGRNIGFLGLGGKRSGAPLSTDDLTLVATLGDYAAIAIDNAVLYDSLETKARQLLKLKAYNENVIESISVGVLVVDPDGHITLWNSTIQAFYGLDREAAIGRRIEDIFPVPLIEAMKSLLDGPGWATRETRSLFKTHLKTAEGREHRTNITMTPFVGDGSIEAGVLILIEDVTEKTQLENQLLQSEKLSSIGLFAAGVAHEVNTPLTGISTYAQLLLKKMSPEDDSYEPLKKIESQSFRASRIVNGLLNFARIDNSDFHELSLNSLMMDTVSLLEHQFKSCNIELDVDLDPYLPKTQGNDGKLQQVFMNLFMNARDAMPKGGKVTVRTHQSDGSAFVEVHDSGCGISADHIKRIYDPFFTTKEVGKGTGLGLSVSYGIIQEHSGTIRVESRPNEGTTFRVQLPIKRVN